MNIYEEDHFRSLDRWRWMRLGIPFVNEQRESGVTLFHCPPWAYVRISPDSGKVVEYDNPNPMPESLYALCDPEFVYETFKDDFVFQLKESRVII